MATTVYGVLGVGAIGAAIVTGLCDGVDRPPGVLLSPRSAGVAAALAARFPGVRVAHDNQAVVDGADVVVLCLRPHDAREALGLLRFRAEQPVVSAMAGVSIEALASLVAPAHDVSRVIPLPSVARRSGMTPVHPPNAAAHALFAALGGAFDVPDVDVFDALSASTSTLSTYFAYLDVIARWLAERGVAEPHATRYVASVFTGLAAELDDARDFAQLAREHTTPGGINAQLHDFLREAGMFDRVGLGLDRVYDRLRAARRPGGT